MEMKTLANTYEELYLNTDYSISEIYYILNNEMMALQVLKQKYNRLLAKEFKDNGIRMITLDNFNPTGYLIYEPVMSYNVDLNILEDIPDSEDYFNIHETDYIKCTQDGMKAKDKKAKELFKFKKKKRKKEK